MGFEYHNKLRHNSAVGSVSRNTGNLETGHLGSRNASTIPASWQSLYGCNPMVPILISYRTILMDGHFPAAGPLALVGLVSAILLSLSYWLFVRASRHFLVQL
jgi:hypothetical protein